MAMYEDAVIDAKKLREVAENAAKQQILEAITPRIRSMINSRILKEQDDDLLPVDDDEDSDDDQDTDDIDDDGDDVDVDSMSSAPSPSISPAPVAPSSSSGRKASVVINNTGDIHIGDNDDGDADDQPMIISDQMAESLAKMIKNEKRNGSLKIRIEKLSENHRLFKEAFGRLVKNGRLSQGQKRKVRDTYRKLTQEAISLRGEVVVNGGGSQRLERKLNETLKEMKTMSSRTKRNIFDFLFEGEEDESKKKEGRVGKKSMDEAELSLSLDDDEKASLADKGEDEIDDALMGVLGDMKFDIAGAEDEDEDSEGDDEGHEKGHEKGDDEGDDEGGDTGGDLDLDEAMYEADDLDEAMYEADDMEEGMHEADKKGETVYEIDESALRRELGKMKTLRESRNRRTRVVAARSVGSRSRRISEQAVSQADQFGGAEVIGDVFYDVDEDSLINVLEDELGSVTKKPTPPGSSVKAEARARRAMKEAAEYQKIATNLQGQLVEMNLFNSKLLYANKLMQNKDLNVKQQKAIVEALDNAKTIREAKLLYKSLSESLARRGQKSGALSENVNRTLGSSSRSTRSAQPASSGVEVDRWAVLAGLPGGK